jgi:hypothetical protein
MPPLAAAGPARPHRRHRLATRAAGVALLAFAALVSASPAHAQTTLTNTDETTPIPRGWFRLGVANAWSRYESRFDSSGGVAPLGAELSTDSLGARQLPRLAPVEGALQTLAANPLQRLTFGKLDVRSDARIVTTPFVLEYGVTRRLSLGVMVPMVQTRRTAQVRVNARAEGEASTSNMGFLPAAQREAAAAANAQVVATLSDAATALNGLLAQCAQNPAAPECDPVRGREADASAAAARAAQFAQAVATAYGTTTETAIVAPLEGSDLAQAVEAQRAALAAQLATYAPGTAVGALTTATRELSYIDLQGRNRVPGLLQSDLGGGLDSIHTSERLSVGDVELRARFLLLDHAPRDSSSRGGLVYRLAIGGTYRFNTSWPDSARDLLDIATGTGAGAEGRAALEVQYGHVGAAVATHYGTSFARTVEVPLVGFPIGGFPYPSFGEVSMAAGDVFGLEIAPRLFLGHWLAFEGNYGLERTGAPTVTDVPEDPCSACTALAGSILPAATTVHRLGLGVRYSTVDAYLRGQAKYPIELSFRHFETVSGDAGVPKLFRDQIQLRIYYRLFR